MVSIKTIQEMKEYKSDFFRGLPDYIEKHSRRVGLYSKILAGNMQQRLKKAYPGIEEAEEILRAVQIGGFYHDIGKRIYADELLKHDGELSDAEKKALSSHPLRSAEIVMTDSDIQRESKAFQRIVFDCCMYHHERYDGKGYPNRVYGRTIPLAAQLISACNFFDALVIQNKPENKADFDYIAGQILQEKYKRFSANIVQCLKESYGEMGAAVCFMKKDKMLSGILS